MTAKLENNTNRAARQSDPVETIEGIYRTYHVPRFLEMDPLVSVRRLEGCREREIGGLVAACLSYGRVEIIIRNFERLRILVGGSFHAFAVESIYAKKKRMLDGFKHRFNGGDDIALLLEAVRSVHKTHGSLEALFESFLREEHISIQHALDGFVGELRHRAAGIGGTGRSSFEHMLSSPHAKSACKRLNMYLRWMVRPDDGIDMGVWKKVSPALLVMPVDAHVGRVSRALGLTKRTVADWRMAQEITARLKKVDPLDPVKYDFSLCRYGMMLFREGSKRGNRT